MASTVFQLSLTMVVFTLMFAIATLPTCTDQRSCGTNKVCRPGKEKVIAQTTITPRPYNETKKTAYPVHRVEVSNGSAVKRLNVELETVTSESTTMAPHCRTVKEASAMDLGALLDARKGAMVTLVTGKTRLKAHKAVLAARSPIFTAMLCRGTQDASSGQVAVPDVEGPVLRQLVAYLYTLQAPQLPDMAPQLLAAADKFGLSALKAECEVQVAKQLSVETAVAAAVLAIRHSSTTLRQTAIAFIRAHLNHVMASQEWADAERYQPDDFIEVNRLLSEPPVETSTPATADTQPSAKATSLPQSSHGPTPVAADSLSPSTSPPEDGAVSHLRSLPSEEKGRRLLEAAKEGRVEVVEALLAAGADVGARDEYSRGTTLHWAAQEGRVEVARRLMQAGAEVDTRGRWQVTPLHWAAWKGRVAVVRLLLASSADPNARTEYRRTPLHFTALDGWAEAAAVLLRAGADKEATDNDGRTPLDYARQYEHHTLIQLLT